MADAPEIKVKLTAEDTGVASAIKELTSQLKNLKKQQDETAQSGISLKNAFSGIVAAAGALGLARIGKEAFDSAVNIGKMADKTGLTTQTLSVFHHVAEETGVATEAVDKALTRGAKSITEFEQGSAKAAKGFALLNIHQKDFAGLNSDQKIALVTSRLGGMAAGFQKATATQLIFSRGGAEFIPVANAIAAEGFDKITASVSKLGLLLDQTTTDSFRAAKASMQELEDAGKGVATQFEAGLLPAISDVADAILESIDISGKSGDGFKEIGKAAGDVVRGIAGFFIWMGTTVAAEITQTQLIFSEQFNEIKIKGTSVYEALSLAVKGHFKEAKTVFDAGSRDIERAQDELAKQQKAIWDDAAVHIRKSQEALNPSDAEERQREKERIRKLRPDKQTGEPPITSAAAPSDAAAKAQLAHDEKHFQDLLAIHRAFAKQDEQTYKDMYEKGELSLNEYYDLRRRAVTKDAQEETAILREGVKEMNKEVQKAALAEKNADTPKDADKQKAARIQALTKVEDLETKITEIEINAATKLKAFDTEEFRRREENQQKILEFNKLVDKTQGDALAAARAEIAIEQQKMALVFQSAGLAQEEIDKKLASYGDLKLAEAGFTEERKEGAEKLKLLDDGRAHIEDQVLNGKLFQAQADQKILDLNRQQLPALQQIADQLKANATTEEQAAQAEDFQTQVDKVKTATNIAGQQMKTLKLGVQDALTGGLTQSFALLFQGTQNVGMAFRNMASSVISSIAQIIAQMYIQLIVTKLLKAAMGGFSGGGSVGGGGGEGHAEGGLIKGPGGPKDDRVPAMLSHGEYVVKADAVATFGVQNLEAINRGAKIPSIAQLALPKFADGGLVGNAGGGGDSTINLGIDLAEGLVLKHLSSKAAGNVILQHLVNNPKAAGKALSRSD
jgi:DNA-binding phage protein